MEARLSKLSSLKQAWRSVSTRILLSYLLVLFLISSVTVIALFRLYQINTSFNVLASRTVSDQVLAQTISEQTLNMRYFLNRYIRTQAQQDKDGFESTQKQLRLLLAQAQSETQTPERQALLQRIAQAEARYATIFDTIADLIRAQDALRSNVLETQALKIESSLTAMRVALTATQDSALFLYFNNTQYYFQSMRLYVSRYLLLGNEGDMTLALASYEQMLKAMNQLEQGWTDPTLTREFERARSALTAYHEGALNIQANYQSLQTLLSDLDKLEPEITGAATAIKQLALDTLERQSLEARQLVQETRTTIFSGMVVAIVLAFVVTIFLTRSITGPLAQVGQQAAQVANVDLRALTTQLNSLSHGDLRLNLNITAHPLAIEGEDEIWQMAAAFNSITESLHEAEKAFAMMGQYLNTMAETAMSVAQRRLDVEVPLHSEQDTLGLALRQMLINLRAAYDEIADQIARLQSLHDINVAITTSRDLEKVLQLIAEKGATLLGAMGIGILLQRDHQLLHFYHGPTHLSEERLAAHLNPSQEREAARMFAEVLNGEHPLWQTLPQDARGYIVKPLVISDTIRGLFYVLRAETTPIPQACLDFITNLVEHIQIAVAYIELIEHLEQRVAERTAELQAQKEEVKRFAYIVSHDLRAPLVNLKGFSSELKESMREFRSLMAQAAQQIDPDLKKQIDTLLDEDVKEALEFIETSVNRMDRFINALLKLSRLGRQDMHLEPVDMNVIVRNTLEALSHQLKEREVTVDVSPLPVIMADRTAMEQIIGNLLDNAVKYLRRDRPGYIRVTVEEEPERFVFHVADNGRGIAETDMDKVFMPFRRLGVQDTPGEGMGLPYVQTLVRRHGGEITCQSVFGQGTTFSFYIPKLKETD